VRHGHDGGVRVLIAPDCFGGTLSAAEACAAIAAGWPGADLAPMSDGGPGFVDVLPGLVRSVTVGGPLGDPLTARWRLDGETAYVEAAQACGLHLLDRPAPEAATTRGVGELCSAAAREAATVVVGLGGSATTDGGVGFLQTWSGGAELVAATDVDNALLGPEGAAAVFGPQKGADAAAVTRLERRLVLIAAGRSEARLPGSGAAGGLGFALLTLGAERVGGAGFVGSRLGLPARVEAADLVVTGEGAYDATSLRGKVTAYVAGLALEAGVPCVVLAGRVEVGRQQAAAHGVTETRSLVDHVGEAAAHDDAAVSLADLARTVARQWA
jgi:glycerate kinase